MPKIQYKEIAFEENTLKIIKAANRIVREYQAQGFNLTLRQLYYQFVARGYLQNKQKNYVRLGSIINDARLAGLMDWLAIVDRTRNLQSLAHYENPQTVVGQLARGYREDIWASQKLRVEVWIEKDALMGILDSVCPEFDVPYFSCRGYTSQSEMWGAAQRIITRAKQGQATVILHFGDHDPSGIDMTRDIEERLLMFTQVHISGDPVVAVKRLALNMSQIERYNPPPNFAKTTDSRHKKYYQQFGSNSWELDALDPVVLANLVRREIRALVDVPTMKAAVAKQEEGQAQLQLVSKEWTKALSACN